MCDTIEQIHQTYNRCYESVMKRRILRPNVPKREQEFNREVLECADDSTEQIVVQLGIDRTELWRLTANPIARVKIVFSLYRRLKVLAEMAESKQTRLDMRWVERDLDQEEHNERFDSGHARDHVILTSVNVQFSPPAKLPR